MLKTSLTILSISFFLMSCGSKKKLTTVDSTSSCKAENIEEIRSFFLTHKNSIPKELKLKGNVKIVTDKEENNLNWQARISLDSVIWISIKKAGFPVAKALINQDSIKVIDIFNRKYLIGSFSELSDMINAKINYSTLQSLFLSTASNLNADTAFWNQENNWVVSNQSKEDYLKHIAKTKSLNTLSTAQWINCEYGFLNQVYIFEPINNQEIWMNYSSPDSSEGFWFNQEINCKVTTNDSLKINTDLSIKSISKENELNLPFSIPSGYEKM